MTENLNITRIEILAQQTVHCEYPYTLDDKEWQEIQMKTLRKGYESRSMR